MVNLSKVEARVLYSCLNRTWAPIAAYREFMAAVRKLEAVSGGEMCRDCSDAGTIPSPMGGKTCQKHFRPRENAQP